MVAGSNPAEGAYRKSFKMNRQKIKKFIREISVPILLLAIYFFLFHFQKVIALPTQNDFLDLVLNFINTQSLFTIFLIALMEGGLLLGQYAPGGVVTSLSIISAGGDISKIILLVSIISLAYLLAYTIDYFIGYYGINKIVEKFGFHNSILRYKRMLEKNVFSTVFFTYWETNIASIVSAAAGSLRISFKKFLVYSVMGVIFWNIFWATLLFFFGNLVLEIFGYKYVLILIIIWIGFIFYRNFLKKEVAPNETS